MHETWDPDTLLASCDHTQRVAFDLLTEPQWRRWEGAPENELDARDLRVPLHVARPEPGACVAVWCLAAFAALVLAGLAGAWVGWWR